MIKLRFTHTIEADDWGEHLDSADCECKPELKVISKDYITVIHNPYYEFNRKNETSSN